MSKRSQVLPRQIVAAMVFVCAIAATSLAATPDRIAGAIDASKTFILEKSVHAKAQPQYDQGPVEPSFNLSSITLLISPSPAQQKALEQLLTEQQDPKSPNYHKWLTPSQYGDRFGLSSNDMQRITKWLTSQGFVVWSTSGGRNWISFSGTAAQVRNAFKAEIHRYNVNGEVHFANEGPLLIPAALQGIVTGVFGTHDFLMHAASQVGTKMRPDYYDNTSPFPNFLSPADVATIYDINPLYKGTPAIDGTGETIGIIGQTDVFLNDINDFRSAFGLSTITCSGTNSSTSLITACSDPHFQYILVPPNTDPGKPDTIKPGDVNEADVDIEWSGAVAPGAQVVYINAPGGNGVVDALKYALSPPTGTALPATVVSMSYGECEYYAPPGGFESILSQASSEGVTIINSTGDSGAAACDIDPPNANVPYTPAVGGLAVSYPATSPYVTAAGGTAISLADDSYPSQNTTYWGTSNGTSRSSGYGGTAKSYIPEMAWNDLEELALYCDSPASGDTFCSQGGTPAVSGWVPLSSTTGAQQVQEDIWISAGGGGASNCFQTSGKACAGGLSQPQYQSKKVTVTNAPQSVRWIPDVSFLASPNFPGYIYCTPQNPDAPTPIYTSTCVNGIAGANGAIDGFQSIIGGTSVSAPLMAGITALLNEYLAGPSSPGLGQLNPTLYQLAVSTAPPAAKPAFNQVKTGDNIVYCQPGTPAAPNPVTGGVCPAGGTIGFSASGSGNSDVTTGYNLVAGLGSVDVANLAAAWNGTRAQTSISISTPSSQVNLGSPTTFTATLSSIQALGNVSFFVNNATTPFATVALTSSDNGVVSTTTTSLPLGSDIVSASYNGDGSHASSTTSPPASVTVVQPNYTYTLVSNLGGSGAGTLSLVQGNSGTLNMTVQSTNGFIVTVAGNQQTAVPVTYSCSGLPSQSNCLFSPNATNSSVTPGVQITTTAPTHASLQQGSGSRILYAFLLPGLFGVVFFAGSRKGSPRSIKMMALILMLGACTMWLGSCGGSNNSSFSNLGTPVGTYPITINATTGGSNPVTATYKFNLTVTNQ